MSRKIDSDVQGSPTLAAFRAKVSASRERAGFTRHGLARRAGINPAVMRDSENGKRIPRLEMVHKLMAVNALGLQIDEVPQEYRSGENLRKVEPRKLRRRSSVPVGFARLSPAEKQALGRLGGLTAQAGSTSPPPHLRAELRRALVDPTKN